jgi:uncharacterized protein (DUF2384 family)
MIGLQMLDSERAAIMAKLVRQVDAMLEESGTAEGFDAAQWLELWVRQPVPALGGVRPIDLLNTADGEALISRTLAQMQSGAYA